MKMMKIRPQKYEQNMRYMIFYINFWAKIMHFQTMQFW